MTKEMSVSEFHKLSHAEHHKLATAHKLMMDEHEGGSPAHGFHKTAHEAHTAISAFHKNAMEKAVTDELNKADRPGDITATVENAVAAYFAKIGATLIPTLVSAVTPNRPGIIAVPRAGAQAIPERPNVPEEFLKLAEVE